MKLSKRQLKRIIREVITESTGGIAPEFRRFKSIPNFLQTVIWPCYQEGYDAIECVNSLGAQEMQFLRRYRNEIELTNDNPEFIGFALEVADMLSQDY